MAGRSEEDLRESDWRSLINAINDHKCTLMIGPHAVTGIFDGERQPVLHGLAAYVKDRLVEDAPDDPRLAALDPSKPASVASAVEDLGLLTEWAEDFFDDVEGEGEVLADLAALPFDLIVNTSPGPSAERVFKEHKPGTRAYFYDRTARAEKSFPDPTVDEPVVYNLYGSLTEPDSLILSDNDRLDFIVSVISDDPPLPMKFKSALKDGRRSFLFLGFDLSQWQLRVLLHVLARNTDRRYRSFASELASVGVDDDTKAYYKIGHKLSFFSMDLADFSRELRSRIEKDLDRRSADGEPAAAGLAEVSPDAPVVFICHASEDKAKAAEIAAGLRENGIATWLDKQELRGGMDWDNQIERVLKQEVDYVVVVQSQHLKAKIDGYVNKEIKIARERQTYIREGFAFIIPVIVDDPSSMLDELVESHSEDLTGAGGIDRLVRAINRDLKKRRPA